MSEIIIYVKPICPYCVKAKQLLKIKGVTDIKEIDISDNEVFRDEMIEKSGGRRTVPQIFINGAHIGGCDDLHALNDAGKLDSLLAS
jgi:glutaredoxin 3